jgi:TolA-binding protein
MLQIQMDLSVTPMLTIVNYEIAEQAKVGEPLALKVFITNPGTLGSGDSQISIQGNDFIQGGIQSINSIAPGQQSSVDVNLNPLQGGRTILAIEIVQDKKVVDTELIWVEIEKKSTILQSFGLSQNTLFVLGGLGLLCLSTLAIGGVFIFTRSRKPKRVPSKTLKSQLSQTPVSSSAEQIKHAIQLAKSNRLQEAFDILREVVKSEPNNASAWFNLGSVLVHMKKYRDAERCYSRAKQLGHPRADEALNSLKQKRQ